MTFVFHVHSFHIVAQTVVINILKIFKVAVFNRQYPNCVLSFTYKNLICSKGGLQVSRVDPTIQNHASWILPMASLYAK